MKKRLFEIVEASKRGDNASKWFDIFIISLIALNVLAIILETVDSFSPFANTFKTFEFFSVMVFTVEYVLRLWSCTADEKYVGAIKGRIKFAFTPLLIIDMLAIVPFYVPLLIPIDLRFLRAIRFFRILRLLKLGRYSESLKMIGIIFKEKKEALGVILFSVAILLVFASSLLYQVEHEAQPKAFSSIPAAMWWGVATLTTVGYGDVYPITPLGKFLGAVISLLGVGLFALPSGILASGFIEAIHQKKSKYQEKCPHCGNNINAKGE